MVKRGDRRFSPPTCPSLTHSEPLKLCIFLRLCDTLSHNSTSRSLPLSAFPPFSVYNHLIMFACSSAPLISPFLYQKDLHGPSRCVLLGLCLSRTRLLPSVDVVPLCSLRPFCVCLLLSSCLTDCSTIPKSGSVPVLTKKWLIFFLHSLYYCFLD